jgi:hypothetical protein
MEDKKRSKSFELKTGVVHLFVPYFFVEKSLECGHFTLQLRRVRNDGVTVIITFDEFVAFPKRPPPHVLVGSLDPLD